MRSTGWIFAAAAAWAMVSYAGLEYLKTIRSTLLRIEEELVRARIHREGPDDDGDDYDA